MQTGTKRSAASAAALADSMRGAGMQELLLDGSAWTYARRGQDVFRVRRSDSYDCGFRFECTMAHWLSVGRASILAYELNYTA